MVATYQSPSAALMMSHPGTSRPRLTRRIIRLAPTMPTVTTLMDRVTDFGIAVVDTNPLRGGLGSVCVAAVRLIEQAIAATGDQLERSGKALTSPGAAEAMKALELATSPATSRNRSNNAGRTAWPSGSCSWTARSSQAHAQGLAPEPRESSMYLHGTPVPIHPRNPTLSEVASEVVIVAFHSRQGYANFD